MSFFKTILKIILIISTVSFLYTTFKKDPLPQPQNTLNALSQDPIQEEIDLAPFSVEKQSFTYEISPQFSYELYGLIVSQYDTESWLDVFHKEDPLNTKDLCVVWGDNAKNGVYQKMSFGSGEFDCHFKFNRDTTSSDWAQFVNTQFSNNHLLTESENIYQAIKEATIGDQIHLKGYLARYSVTDTDGSTIRNRGTSTNRTDTGMGACETIFVTEFKILKKGNTTLSTINQVSKYSTLSSLVLLVILFFIT